MSIELGSGNTGESQGGEVDIVDLSGNMARMKDEMPARMKCEL